MLNESGRDPLIVDEEKPIIVIGKGKDNSISKKAINSKKENRKKIKRLLIRLSLVIGGVLIVLSIIATIVRDFNKYKPVVYRKSENSQFIVDRLTTKIDFSKYNLEGDAVKLEKVLWEN